MKPWLRAFFGHGKMAPTEPSDPKIPGTEPPLVAKPLVPEKRPRNPDQWVHRPMEKYRKNTRPLAFRPGVEFFELADPVVQTRRTLLGYDRLYTFWQAIGNVKDLEGAVAEIGSFRGGSAYFVASAFVALTGAEAEVHVFDTFEGHPGEKITEHDPFHKAGQFADTSFEDVKGYLSPFRSLRVHKGEISASLPHLAEQTFRLIHIDTDLYLPTLDCLNYFGPRMVAGGVIVIDDYASGKCPGVPRAVVEYLEGTNDFHAWDMRTEQLMLVRR
jgi:hypothetical protein